MPRLPRFHPDNRDGVLVEVTVRTIGAQALLVPAPEPRRFNEIVVGVMGRALEVSPLELCAAVVLANHLHLLVVVHEQQELSRFMHHFLGNLSKEVGRIRRRRGPMWARRYDAIVVSDEPEAQWKRLRYVLSHGVKEGLCESPLDWPGVHSARAIVHGERLEGCWFSRSMEWHARNQGKDYGYYDYATRYRIGFAPVPALRHLTSAEYGSKVAELVREIEEQYAKERAGEPVAGAEKILSQNPYEAPTRKTKHSPKPLFHAATKQVWADLWNELSAFLGQYRNASDALRSGGRQIVPSLGFPDGCYPPALPYAGARIPTLPSPPPTRAIHVLESGVVERGPIPVVDLPIRIWAVEPRARGHPS